jgi:hypothetical protein
MFYCLGFHLCLRICPYEGPENQKVLKTNAIHQLLVYDNDVNILGDNINTIRENTKALIDPNNEAALAVNA